MFGTDTDPIKAISHIPKTETRETLPDRYL